MRHMTCAAGAACEAFVITLQPTRHTTKELEVDSWLRTRPAALLTDWQRTVLFAVGNRFDCATLTQLSGAHRRSTQGEQCYYFLNGIALAVGCDQSVRTE